METTRLVLVMLLAVVLSRVIARATNISAPVVQIGLGAAVFSSGLTSAALDPEVFFLLLLPPLLFLDGWRIPKDDLLHEAPTIVTLSLGLVVFTVLGIGLFVHWLIPALPLAVAFALAAVISPTDPIAVSAIARRTPMPIRMQRILEGESLFNDASGLVCMRFAVAAELTGAFSLWGALLSFVWVALGGLFVGAGVTWVVTKARPTSVVLVGEDGGAHILATLLIPFGVYLLAELLGCSGILAAVAAGITMGFSPHAHWQAVTRIRRTAVWDTVQFAANGSIFVLLGEQIPSIVLASKHTVLLTGHQNPWWLAVYVFVVVVALASLRLMWVWASMKMAFFGQHHNRASLPPVRNRLVLAMSLAGVRGAITLAGVLTLPLTLPDGAPFPGRDLAIFLAAGVIVFSLLLACFALPTALKGLELAPEKSLSADECIARSAAGDAAIRAIDSFTRRMAQGQGDAALYAQASARIALFYRQRAASDAENDTAQHRQDRSQALERTLRLAGLKAERDEILKLGATHVIAELTVRKLVREIDLQEAGYSS